MPYNPTPGISNQLYTNGAVRFDTRQIANMLYQEQRQRQALQAKENADMEKMLQDEIGKIRSADTQLAVDSYNTYKNLRRTLYDKKLQRDPVAYAERQRQSDLAYRDLMGILKGSQQFKEIEKGRTQARLANPDNFSDDMPALMAASIKTPYNQLNKVNVNGKDYDLTSDEPFLYTGTNTDFAALDKVAAGDKQERYWDRKAMDSKGLQTEITAFKSGNSAQQRYDAYIGQFHKRGAGRDASRALDALPAGEFERVEAEYNKIAPDVLEKKGAKAVDKIDYDPANKASKYAAYRAMKSYTEDLPEAQKPTTQTNDLKKMELEQNNRMALARYNKQAREDLAKLKRTWKKDDAKGNEAAMGGFVDSMIDKARKNNSFEFVDAGGKRIDVWELPNMPSLKKAMQIKDKFGKDAQPEQFVVDKDGNIYSVFYKKATEKVIDPTTKKETGEIRYTGGYEKNAKGRIRFDADMTSKISKDIIVAELSKQMLPDSKVELGAGDDDDDDDDSGSGKGPIQITEVESYRTKYNY